MYSKLSKNIALSSIVFLGIGCASTSTKDNIDTPDCSKTLTFVESSENTVSEDGFTILYDGENKEVFEDLLREALANQKAYGCKTG